MTQPAHLPLVSSSYIHAPNFGSTTKAIIAWADYGSAEGAEIVGAKPRQ